MQDARKEGIDAVQGFVLARPTPAAELTQLFARSSTDAPKIEGADMI